jgi:hypothetical protein
MSKLRLELDSVTVESFPVESHGEEKPGVLEAYVTAGSRTCLVPFCS